MPEGFNTALRVLSITLVLDAFNEVFFSYLRLKERPKAYVAANLLRFVGQLLLNILFIVYLGFGYWGIILAAVISKILALLLPAGCCRASESRSAGNMRPDCSSFHSPSSSQLWAFTTSRSVTVTFSSSIRVWPQWASTRWPTSWD